MSLRSHCTARRLAAGKARKNDPLLRMLPTTESQAGLETARPVLHRQDHVSMGAWHKSRDADRTETYRALQVNRVHSPFNIQRLPSSSDTDLSAHAASDRFSPLPKKGKES